MSARKLSAKRVLAVAAFGAAVVGWGGGVKADDFFWTGEGVSTSYFDVLNWGGAVPGDTDAGIFSAGDALVHGVKVDEDDAAIGEVWVNAGKWAFAVDGGNTWTALGSFNFDGSVPISATVGGEGNYVVKQTRFSGALEAGSLAVQCVVSLTGANWDSSGTGVNGSGLFDVGVDGGGASVALLGGSQVTADFVRVGEGGDSQGRLVVSGEGTHLTSVSGMQMGAGGGTGDLVVELGALADLAGMTLANYGSGGGANATISGVGTVLNVLPVAASGGHDGGDGALTVGVDGQAHMVVSGGATVNAAWLVMGESSLAEAVGNLTVENATTSFHVMGDAVIGVQGRGTLTVRDSAVFHTGSLEVGREGAGRVVIDGATAQIYDTMWVGAYGSGELTLEGEARLSTANLAVGHFSEGTGSIDVTGMGTELQVTSDIFLVGAGGKGTLAIAGGGRVTAVDHVIAWFDEDGNRVDEEVEGGYAAWASAWLIVGDQLEAAGTITVGGLGSVLEVQNAPMTVGGNGSGMLMVTDQGLVAITKGELRIGQESGSQGVVDVAGKALVNTANLVIGQYGTGTATVTGAETELRVTAGTFNVGMGGTGTLAIADGGRATAVDHVVAWYDSEGNLVDGPGEGAIPAYSSAWVIVGGAAGGTGTITVSGMDSVLEVQHSPVMVGGNGTGFLTVTDHGLVTMGDGELWIGKEAGSRGMVEIRGAQLLETSWYPSEVGGKGTGSLTIAQGGAVSLSLLAVGVEYGATGVVDVSGEDSSLTVVNGLVVGNVGTGSLAIRQWATAACNDLRVGMSNDTYKGQGMVSVTDSTLTVYDPGMADGNLWIGYTGRGSLAVEAGGLVNAPAGNLFVGGFAGSEGEVTVAGDNAQLIAMRPVEGDYGSWVGREGVGRLTISNAGYVKVSRLTVGEQPGGAGYVTITSGAVLEVAHDIQLGVAALGAMHLDGGVVVLGDQQLVVREFGTLTGTGEVRGAVINEGGVVTPGDTGDLLTVNYYGQNAGSLVFSLAGNERGISYDAMDVLAVDGAMGNVQLFDGTLRIVVGEGFSPALGDTFELIHAANGIQVLEAVNIQLQGWPSGLDGDVRLFEDGLGAWKLQVSVVEAVPEPASLAVLGLGVAGLLLRRRR